jgi:hypothetical protein
MDKNNEQKISDEISVNFAEKNETTFEEILAKLNKYDKVLSEDLSLYLAEQYSAQEIKKIYDGIYNNQYSDFVDELIIKLNVCKTFGTTEEYEKLYRKTIEKLENSFRHAIKTDFLELLYQKPSNELEDLYNKAIKDTNKEKELMGIDQEQYQNQYNKKDKIISLAQKRINQLQLMTEINQKQVSELDACHQLIDTIRATTQPEYSYDERLKKAKLQLADCAQLVNCNFDDIFDETFEDVSRKAQIDISNITPSKRISLKQLFKQIDPDVIDEDLYNSCGACPSNPYVEFDNPFFINFCALSDKLCADKDGQKYSPVRVSVFLGKQTIKFDKKLDKSFSNKPIRLKKKILGYPTLKQS